ncbi:hypothetical protein [Streptomyces sp. 1222.5]|uniref:hypothetical protein n=1 Tax=Streptomyces sp. 1222.5 TaxID=1881026 RepID=UPI003EB90B8F
MIMQPEAVLWAWRSCGEGEVVHAGDGLDRVMEAVAALFPAGLLVVAAAAWVWMVTYWGGMPAMPGTMGLGPAAFLGRMDADDDGDGSGS